MRQGKRQWIKLSCILNSVSCRWKVTPVRSPTRQGCFPHLRSSSSIPAPFLIRSSFLWAQQGSHSQEVTRFKLSHAHSPTTPPPSAPAQWQIHARVTYNFLSWCCDKTEETFTPHQGSFPQDEHASFKRESGQVSVLWLKNCNRLYWDAPKHKFHLELICLQATKRQRLITTVWKAGAFLLRCTTPVE